MIFHSVEELLIKGEGLHCEFKEAYTGLPKNIFETVCAFLNTDGGTILLGVNDSGQVTGIKEEIAIKIKKELVSQSNNSNKIDPSYLLFPEVVKIQGKQIVVVNVPLSSQVHRLAGEIYLRSEDGDYKVHGTHQLAGLFNRKQGMFSEQRLFPQFDLSDLRPDLFNKARRLIGAYNGDHPWLKLNDEDLLKIAGFHQENRETGKRCLTLAAILMFGSDEAIQSAAPAYRFDCLLRRNNVDRYDDRVMISTNLIEAYDQMMAFVEKHLNEPFYLEGDMRVSLRSKIFREAVSNIISHREYIHGSPGRLIVYRDNVIFDNPCTPHYSGRITPQNLVPYARNPVICHFMIQLGRFEQLGSGVTNIYKYLPLYADGAIPVFEEIRDCFRLTLPLKNDTAKLSTELTPEVSPEDTPEVTHEVAPEVIKILGVIEGDITRVEIMSKLDLKDELNFRERYLKPALEAGFVEMTIPDKPNSRNQKYRLTSKGISYMKSFVFDALTHEVTPEDNPEVTHEVTPEDNPEVTHEVTPEVIKILGVIEGNITRVEIMSKLDLKDELNFRERYLKPALDAGFVEMTIPDKPNSRNQKYRLTSKGKIRRSYSD